MRNIFLAVLIAVVCVSAMACGGSGTNNVPGGTGATGWTNSTPEGLAKLIGAALEEKNADKAASFFATEDRDAAHAEFADAVKKWNENKTTVTIKFSNISMQNESATADMTITGKGPDGKEADMWPSRVVKMVKRDGKWWAKK